MHTRTRGGKHKECRLSKTYGLHLSAITFKKKAVHLLFKKKLLVTIHGQRCSFCNAYSEPLHTPHCFDLSVKYCPQWQ